MSKFEGLYFKHQKSDNSLAIIPGRSEHEAFVQIITEKTAFYIPYPLSEYHFKGIMQVGNNYFARNGMILNIAYENIRIKGYIRYHDLVPIKYDIMGPFHLFPMECRHTVISMKHRLDGKFLLNDTLINFDNGLGYLEGDRGRSFPKGYSWVHCNMWDDADHECSIMAAAARIPFGGMRFQGCIAIVWYRGKEYRLATYKGAQVYCQTERELIINQGKLSLHVHIPKVNGQTLYAPIKGMMRRQIQENIALRARFQLRLSNDVILDKWSSMASYEYVPQSKK